MRGGGAGKDGSVSGGPGCMPIGRGRSGGGVRPRPVSGLRGEGGGVLPRGQERAGHWWWYWMQQGAEDGLRFVWRHMICHLQSKQFGAMFLTNHQLNSELATY